MVRYVLPRTYTSGETDIWTVPVTHPATGVAVSLAEVDAITLTLQDDAGNVINSRSAQDVLNAHDCTFDSSGLTWNIAAADTTLSSATSMRTRHTGTFILTLVDGEAAVVQAVLSITRALYGSYPGASDVAALLASASIATTGMDLATAAAAGVREFEKRANRRFLADAADVTRLFNPPVNRTATLVIPDLASFTSILYQPLNAAAVTFTENDDFWLLDANAVQMGVPYDRIQFRRGRWYGPVGATLRSSLLVTGRWGYGLTVPEDAWRAMVAAGALYLFPEATSKRSGGMLSWQGANVRVDWGVDPGGATRKGWTDTVEGALARYRRYWF